jgi:tetratricopeptide (TPR) repeat protein
MAVNPLNPDMARTNLNWKIRWAWICAGLPLLLSALFAAEPATHEISEPPSIESSSILRSSRLSISPLGPLQSSEWTTLQPIFTNNLTAASLNLNPALRDSFQLVSTTNMTTALHDAEITPEEQRQMLFNMARMHHAQKNYEQATHLYSTLLNADPPQSMAQYALIDLAVMAQEQDQPAKALQILSQYARKYPTDPGVPEVLLRQGLIYRQMGVPSLALAKFYSVMTSALTLKQGHIDYYQRLVLLAQTEIAETSYAAGKFDEAADFFTRLLKQETPDLNKVQIEYKLVRCLAGGNRHSEAIAQASTFLEHNAGVAEEPEVRFILVNNLKQTGQKQDALKQTLALLRTEQEVAAKYPERWLYWQQRTGNEVGNQLYQEADYLNALEIYTSLASINKDPRWQLPVLYQIGLVYERLQQPQKAVETYQRIIAHQKELASDTPSGVKTVVDMAIWRNDFLNWNTQAERYSQTNALIVTPPPRRTASAKP